MSVLSPSRVHPATQLVDSVTTGNRVHNGLLDDAFFSQRRCGTFTESPDLRRCNIFRLHHLSFFVFFSSGMAFSSPQVSLQSGGQLRVHGMCPLLARHRRLNPFSHCRWEGRRESSMVCVLLPLHPSCSGQAQTAFIGFGSPESLAYHPCLEERYRQPWLSLSGGCRGATHSDTSARTKGQQIFLHSRVLTGGRRPLRFPYQDKESSHGCSPAGTQRCV